MAEFANGGLVEGNGSVPTWFDLPGCEYIVPGSPEQVREYNQALLEKLNRDA